MMEQRPLDPRCGYTEEQALEWLARLARALRDRSQTEFHLDRLAPDWLPTPAHQLRARVATGLVGGVVSGLVFGPGFGLVAQAFGLTFTVPTAVMVGLVAGLIFGLIGGLVFGLAGRLTTSFEQSYPLRGFWSALRARLGRPLTQGRHKQQTGLNGAMQEPPYIAPVATVFGLVGGLAAGLSSGLFFGLTLGLLAALAAGLGCGLTVALVLGLSGELLFEQSEQLRWSWSNLRTGLSRALFGGLAGGLVFGLLFALVFGASAGVTFGLVFGLTVALAGGLSAGLGFGLVFALTVAMVFGGAACLQHYVVRAWLVRDKIAPWQYGPFLEAMAQRLLLRRSGSAYLFTRRLLRDYLADPNPVRIQAAA